MMGIADIAFTPSAANQDVSTCSEAVRCDRDAEVCLFVAFICGLVFPFCNKSHVVFFLRLLLFSGAEI